MRVLLTNDDGVHAEGLLALKTAISRVAEVVVVAPDRPRSASGHSITLHKPLRVSHVRLGDGSPAMATSGTPSDCVMLALRAPLMEKPDIVISGINDGPNLGWDLTYSGTVSAAMEASFNGIPSIAMSVVRLDGAPYIDALEPVREDRAPLDFSTAASFGAHLVAVLADHPVPSYTLLNVNVPSVPGAEIRGVEITRQGIRKYPGQVDRRIDPMGRAYYWLGGDIPEDIREAGTDVHAIANRTISVTPVHMDLTAYAMMDEMHRWERVEDFKPDPLPPLE